MPKHVGSEGLYTKKESPIVNSVRQTEGLYKRVKVAKVEAVSPDDNTVQKVQELENSSNNESTKRVLAG